MSVAGRLFYKLFHKPFLSPLKEHGGAWNWFMTTLGRYRMQKAAAMLTVPDYQQLHTEVTVVAVAGKNNWYQMIFCLYSFYKQLGFNLNTVIIDDGTLNADFQQQMARQVPYLKIIPAAKADTDAAIYFNNSSYAVLSKIYNQFIVFKKLFHARLLVKGPALVLDADMLFYSKPVTLISWILNPAQPVYMYDKHSVYGMQNQQLIKHLTATPHVNTGIIGWNNDDFDFSKIERYAELYLKADNLNYLMEQALYAMYINEVPSLRLPADEYEILPSKPEAQKPTAVMHHFPTENRQYYFRYAWRHIVGTNAA